MVTGRTSSIFTNHERHTVRKAITILGMVLALFFGSTQSAQAVTTIKRGGTCYLSANWPVGMSATWYDGELAYVVWSSPAPLSLGSGYTYGYAWNSQNPNYDYVLYPQQWGAGPPYVYRADYLSSTQNPNLNKVLMQARVVPPKGTGDCHLTFTR